MTGKELKAWASTVSDDAVIAVKERSSYRFEEVFTLQASLVWNGPRKKRRS